MPWWACGARVSGVSSTTARPKGDLDGTGGGRRIVRLTWGTALAIGRERNSTGRSAKGSPVLSRALFGTPPFPRRPGVRSQEATSTEPTLRRWGSTFGHEPCSVQGNKERLGGERRMDKPLPEP